MRTLYGLIFIICGVCLWGVAISLLITWLAFCFGTVIIGVLLLIFAPYVLMSPLAISVPANAALGIGMDMLINAKDNSSFAKHYNRNQESTDKRTTEEKRLYNEELGIFSRL